MPYVALLASYIRAKLVTKSTCENLLSLKRGINSLKVVNGLTNGELQFRTKENALCVTSWYTKFKSKNSLEIQKKNKKKMIKWGSNSK